MMKNSFFSHPAVFCLIKVVIHTNFADVSHQATGSMLGNLYEVKVRNRHSELSLSFKCSCCLIYGENVKVPRREELIRILIK